MIVFRWPVRSKCFYALRYAKRDGGDTALAHAVKIEQEDLVTYSPVTEHWIGREVSVDALCDATMRTSDNAAANKVLEVLGGPQSVTNFMRSIGDNSTRLDRFKTGLNSATPDDLRDTTTPSAMASSLRELIFGEALAPSSRTQLTEWLVDNEVGGPLLRAGWRAWFPRCRRHFMAARAGSARRSHLYYADRSVDRTAE